MEIFYFWGMAFWENRSKIGRPKLFSDPETLWEQAVLYFKTTDERKWVKKDWVGKDAIEVERESETPYTISGLCLFFNCSRHWWNEFYKSRKAANDEPFLEVLARIENIMFTQKFEGAAVGAFNHSIISRDLGLVDKSDLTSNGETVRPVWLTDKPDGSTV